MAEGIMYSGSTKYNLYTSLGHGTNSVWWMIIEGISGKEEGEACVA